MGKKLRVRLTPYAYHELQMQLISQGYEAANHGRGLDGIDLGDVVVWKPDPPAETVLWERRERVDL